MVWVAHHLYYQDLICCASVSVHPEYFFSLNLSRVTKVPPYQPHHTCFFTLSSVFSKKNSLRKYFFISVLLWFCKNFSKQKIFNKMSIIHSCLQPETWTLKNEKVLLNSFKGLHRGAFHIGSVWASYIWCCSLVIFETALRAHVWLASNTCIEGSFSRFFSHLKILKGFVKSFEEVQHFN